MHGATEQSRGPGPRRARQCRDATIIGEVQSTTDRMLTILPFLRLPPLFLQPKPGTCPEGFPEGQGGWPLYFALLAFGNNRAFGALFMLGLLVEVLIRNFLPLFWR